MSQFGAVIRTRLLGIAFILLLAALVALSILSYQKAFKPVAMVTLTTDRIGNQTQVGADVKLRGVIIGDVRQVSSRGSGARLSLALDTDKIGLVPANVVGRLLPKTLFGEKYVEFVVPPVASPDAVRAGQTLRQDTSAYSVELQRVLNNLLPLLKTLQPDKLSATLNAISTALSGRGDAIGANLVRLDRYLRRLNVEMPTLQHDIRQLATTAGTYADASGDLLALLRNFSVTSRTLYQQRTNLSRLFSSTTATADSVRVLLTETGDQLIQVSADSRPILAVLARYSPEFPCLLKALSDQSKTLDYAFRDRRLHVTVEIVRNNGKYQQNRDEPVFGANGPYCYGIPNPQQPFPNYKYPTGYDWDLTRNPAPIGMFGAPAGSSGGSGGGAAGGVVGQDVSMGNAGTPSERKEMNLLLAPQLDRSPEQVPTVAPMLYGPLVRGTQVTVS